MPLAAFFLGTATGIVVTLGFVACVVAYALRGTTDDPMAEPFGEGEGIGHRQHIRTGRR